MALSPLAVAGIVAGGVLIARRLRRGPPTSDERFIRSQVGAVRSDDPASGVDSIKDLPGYDEATSGFCAALAGATAIHPSDCGKALDLFADGIMYLHTNMNPSRWGIFHRSGLISLRDGPASLEPGEYYIPIDRLRRAGYLSAARDILGHFESGGIGVKRSIGDIHGRTIPIPVGVSIVINPPPERGGSGYYFRDYDGKIRSSKDVGAEADSKNGSIWLGFYEQLPPLNN